jgi:hypothetical protein
LKASSALARPGLFFRVQCSLAEVVPTPSQGLHAQALRFSTGFFGESGSWNSARDEVLRLRSKDAPSLQVGGNFEFPAFFQAQYFRNPDPKLESMQHSAFFHSRIRVKPASFTELGTWQIRSNVTQRMRADLRWAGANEPDSITSGYSEGWTANVQVRLTNSAGMVVPYSLREGVEMTNDVFYSACAARGGPRNLRNEGKPAVYPIVTGKARDIRVHPCPSVVELDCCDSAGLPTRSAFRDSPEKSEYRHFW